MHKVSAVPREQVCCLNHQSCILSQLCPNVTTSQEIGSETCNEVKEIDNKACTKNLGSSHYAVTYLSIFL